MIKGIYLASKKHRIAVDGYEFKYNDIVPFDGIDFACDMMEVDLDPYDVLIATPPCNYYSRANYRRETSEVAQMTKHLLPDIIKKFKATGKPFLVENVWAWNYFPEELKRGDLCVMSYYGHYFFSNIFMFGEIQDYQECEHKDKKGYGYRDGNKAVRDFMDWWLRELKDPFYATVYMHGRRWEGFDESINAI